MAIALFINLSIIHVLMQHEKAPLSGCVLGFSVLHLLGFIIITKIFISIVLQKVILFVKFTTICSQSFINLRVTLHSSRLDPVLASNLVKQIYCNKMYKS